MSDSYQAVLDRDYAIEAAKRFKDAINLLDEMVDYGTHLIPRAFDSSPKDLKAICVIFVQLRQFLEHLDGVAILVAAGNPATANLQLRSLLETSHTMEWLLKSDTESKVNHLYVANLRLRRHSQSIVIPGTPQATRHAAAAAGIPVTPEQLKEVTEEIQRIDTILGRPPFDSVNAKFDPHYLQRGFDEPWYKAYGAASIRKIADELGKLKEYTYLYSPLSGVTHGSDMWKNIVIGDKIQVNPLRQPQYTAQAVRLAASFALHVYRLILQQYRPAEEENFNRKYLIEWRARFLKEYRVELTPKEIII